MILYFERRRLHRGHLQLVHSGVVRSIDNREPGAGRTPSGPDLLRTADMDLRITTDAALSIDIAVYGYELMVMP